MAYLLGKTKGRNGDFFKILHTNRQVYDIPEDLNNAVSYTPDYKLEEDEWFAITEFSTKDYFIDFLSRHFTSTEYNQLPRSEYINVEYLVSHQSGVYCFQKIYGTQIIRKKYFSVSNEPSLVSDIPIITLNEFPDAIYMREDDTLYFRKLTAITTIFRGVEALYREATQEETEEFLQNDFIEIQDSFTADKVKIANRKRIAMAKDTLGRFSAADKRNIFSYIREYCGNLNFDEDDETFSISNEEDLKKLLYGIEQRYYTTLIGNERRLANSIITITNE